MKLSILSLNIAGYKEWGHRENKIVAFINGNTFDIVLLQEIKYDPTVSPLSQALQLNALFEEPFPFTQTTVNKFYMSSNGNDYREGLAVLSRFPITNSEVLVLKQHPDDKHPRIVQNIDLSINKRQLFVSNIHLSNNEHSVSQLSELLSILKSRNEKRIIAGDFNIFSLSDHKQLYDKEYTATTEVKKYISYPSENRTLDYALVPKEYAFHFVQVFDGLSDHNALHFTVEL